MTKISRLLAALSVAAAGAVFAGGSRYVNTDGVTLPSAATDGVDLRDTTGCRASVVSVDGGGIMGGKLVPYYYDAAVGWHQGGDVNVCNLDTSTAVDGGKRFTQTCEWAVNVPYGRAYVMPQSLLGGSGAAAQADSVHLECFGDRISVKAGAGAQ